MIFRSINEAYKILKNTKQRQIYDRQRNENLFKSNKKEKFNFQHHRLNEFENKIKEFNSYLKQISKEKQNFQFNEKNLFSQFNSLKTYRQFEKNLKKFYSSSYFNHDSL